MIHPFRRCAENFSCHGTETVHFKFDRFDTENGYDYFVIGFPSEFEYYYNYFESVGIEIEKPADQIGLIMDGSQQTGIWVNAQSIPSFNIYFYRNVLKMHLK